MSLKIVFLIFIVHILPDHVAIQLHLKGKWNSNEFFIFLAKFGVQKSDPNEKSNTQGYIYGNVTTNDTSNFSSITLVVVDSAYFLEFYRNRTKKPPKACPNMFNKIDTVSYDSVCYPLGKQDFLRKIPCPKNKLCVDEDNPGNVIPNYQFTYKIVDTQQPRFWYISFVSCKRHVDQKQTKCSWINSNHDNIEISYDIWLVNGDPSVKHVNPFEHQFSFELHDVFEIYAFFLVIYLFLVPMSCYVYTKQRHTITLLVTTLISVIEMGILMNIVDVFKFSFDGEGVPWLSTLGKAADILSQCLLMLLLLFIAKGWTITTLTLHHKPLLFIMWISYTTLNVVLFVWSMTEIDVISNVDEWQTWPGYITVGCRLVIMVWFLYELRRTHQRTGHCSDYEFFQHFGAFILVWFIYRPILVLISTQISALWKYKTVLSISFAADFLAFAVIIHMFWPSKSVLYKIRGEQPLPAYDLEVTGLLDDVEFTVTTKNKKSSESNYCKDSACKNVQYPSESEKQSLLSDDDI